MKRIHPIRIVWIGTILLVLNAAAIFAASQPAGATGPVPQLPWYTKTAPKLPWPSGGNVVEVRTVQELMAAVNNRPAANTTILVHDGTYNMPDILWVRNVKNFTLRGYSGNRDKVILDAAKSKHEDMMWITNSDTVMIADITFQNSRVHGIAVKGESDTQNTRIYNCVFHNIWERKIKGTSAANAAGQPAKAADPHVLATRPHNGRIEYCLFFDDHKKNYDDFANGDYIAGIDMMWLKNWVVSDNVFMNIQGRNGLARGAIFLWNHCEDVIVERNLIVNCDRGICIGNPSGGPVHMTRGIVRNNMVIRGLDCGMEIVKTVDCQIYNNTVWGQNPGYRQALQVKMGPGSCKVFNNFVRGVISIEETGSIEENNQVGALDNFFVDPAGGNLHLTTIGQAAAQGRSMQAPKDFLDWDGGLRPAQASIGADEMVTTVPKNLPGTSFPPPATAAAGSATRPTAAAPAAPAVEQPNPDRERTIRQTRMQAAMLLSDMVAKHQGMAVSLLYKGSSCDTKLIDATVADGLKVKIYGASRTLKWDDLSTASLAGLLEMCSGIRADPDTGAIEVGEAAIPAENFSTIALLYAIENQPVAAAQAMQKAIDQDPELKDPIKTALAMLK